jgi:hypothetical protein
MVAPAGSVSNSHSGEMIRDNSIDAVIPRIQPQAYSPHGVMNARGIFNKPLKYHFQNSMFPSLSYLVFLCRYWFSTYHFNKLLSGFIGVIEDNPLGSFVNCRFLESPIISLASSGIAGATAATVGELPSTNLFPTAHTSEWWLIPITLEIYVAIRRVRFMHTKTVWTELFGH